MYGAPERYKLQRKLEQQKNPHMDLAGKKEREQDIAYVAALIYTCSGVQWGGLGIGHQQRNAFRFPKEKNSKEGEFLPQPSR